MSAAPAPDNHARLRVAAGPLVAPVLSRVVGMLAARAQCPIDRLDDALLLADAVAAHAPHFSADDCLSVQVHADVQGLSLIVDGLRPGACRDLVAAAELPGVGNVLRRVANEVDEEPDGNGLRIRLGFR
jgi:serine/threonine-protein kinase RsbW